VNRLIAWSVAAVIGLGIGQSMVPEWAADAIARAIAARDGGVRPAVTVVALPFWQLASGAFQEVRLVFPALRVDGMQVRAARLIWRDGAVKLGGLRQGHIEIARRGTLTVAFAVTGEALARFLGNTAGLRDADVRVDPSGLRVAGRVRLHGATVPLVAEGRLELGDAGQAVFFRALRIDGVRLPFPTVMRVLNLPRLHLSVPLRLTTMVLGHNQIRFQAMVS
jgi:hypothetical protein